MFYWNIGKNIVTGFYGESYFKRNLELMCQFYNYFSNANALRSQLSWAYLKY